MTSKRGADSDGGQEVEIEVDRLEQGSPTWCPGAPGSPQGPLE